LWKVGARSFLVEHALGATEAALVDTDRAMVEHPLTVSARSSVSIEDPLG